MYKLLKLASAALFSLSTVGVAHAQLMIPNGHYIYPTSPTSADNLRLTLAHGNNCTGRFFSYLAPYTVAMAQNNIVVTMGRRDLTPVLCTGTSSFPAEEIDLGRLPAGNYTVTVNFSPLDGGVDQSPVVNFPLTVVDARVAKAAPYVWLDYSGHWWDPNDSGWGLFVWHDAKSRVDNILAAWFTYTPDGKPMWYVFQPAWESGVGTKSAPLLQASRPPGATSPPPTPTSSIAVGTASLNFSKGSSQSGTSDGTGKITYTFNGGPTITRNIQRFAP